MAMYFFQILGGNQHNHHSGDTPIGCPKKLAEFIRKGQYDPTKASSITAPELRTVCQSVDIPAGLSSTKVCSINIQFHSKAIPL